MNILLLMAGADIQSRGEVYPSILTEVGDKPLIQIHVEMARRIYDARLIFAVRESDSKKFHLNNIISIIAPQSPIVPVRGNTQGAACTALLAIEYINNDQPLLIVSANELVKADYNHIIKYFSLHDYDAGVVVFNSVHPKYSYVRIDDNLGSVVEAAEKNPISSNATAGFYYFKKGGDFVKSVQSMIKKSALTDGQYFICPSLNEMVLFQKRVGYFRIENSAYVPLKSEANLETLVNKVAGGTHEAF